MKKLNYKIPSKPIVYKGVKFKSKLEAQWAKFFDAKGWVWKYEPFSIVTWLPDFSVQIGDFYALIEVKPKADMFSLDKYEIALIRHKVVMLCTDKIQSVKYLIGKKHISIFDTSIVPKFEDSDAELFEMSRF
jgi:hypothetical protein